MNIPILNNGRTQHVSAKDQAEAFATIFIQVDDPPRRPPKILAITYASLQPIRFTLRFLKAEERLLAVAASQFNHCGGKAFINNNPGRNYIYPKGQKGPQFNVSSESFSFVVGPLRIEFSQSVNLEEVKKINPLVREGGRFAPADCIALQKVALIIPFRNRDEHLKYWLYYLHPILQRQQLDYGVYVINQHGRETFNRAKLLNIGFVEALKEYDYNCFVFSDVDLIPMDDRNIYKCYSQPRHIAVSMDKFSFRLPYKQFFGGISALSREQHEKINGFPNDYWGWGGEDDDIYNRIVFKGMGISRPDGVIGKCRMIRHNRDENNAPNPQRFSRIAHTRQTMQLDGLNSLKYEVLEVKKYPLYTFIDVDVGGPGRRPPSR
ncbi:beta-1,4-galactosyltransferase 1-like [Heterodontus francisci]|uniref:beta-1,4-galactosyltransferase 1-like n=1 Tax=Heterodontus francisci TaxID=7792 RepID=UPI00355C02F4